MDVEEQAERNTQEANSPWNIMPHSVADPCRWSSTGEENTKETRTAFFVSMEFESTLAKPAPKDCLGPNSNILQIHQRGKHCHLESASLWIQATVDTVKSFISMQMQKGFVATFHHLTHYQSKRPLQDDSSIT